MKELARAARTTLWPARLARQQQPRPAAHSRRLRHGAEQEEFTNGADSATVINLYRDTATALLGSTKELRYDKLEWKDAEFERLGEALCYCGALEALVVNEMELSDIAAAAVVAGLASCRSLKTLHLFRCKSLTALPDLSALTSLQTLRLGGAALSPAPRTQVAALRSLQIPHGAARPVGAHVAAELNLISCKSLMALLGLSGLTSLQTLDLHHCFSLTALPDLSALTSLLTLNLERCIPHGTARPVGDVAADARPQLLQVLHGAALPISAHVAAAARPPWLQFPHCPRDRCDFG